jgi:hypothetical protein
MLTASWGHENPAMNALSQAGVIRAGGALTAAADFLGNGAIEINKYESEILDIVRRESPVASRFRRTPATGQPHRYFEQTFVATAGFVNITAGSALGTPTASGPGRVERSAFVKALSAQTNLSLFDVDVTRQQGQFAQVEARDISDISSGIARAEAAGIWTGTDTSLTTPTTNQYVGLLTQINQTLQIANGASIIDGLKAQVAYMAANSDFTVRPNAIYINPILGDYIDREAKASKVTLTEMTVGGVVVKALATQAGVLPLVGDPFMPTALSTGGAQYGFTTPASGLKNYFAAILTDDLIEMPTVHGGDGNMKPRLFQLGLVGGLQGQYVGVLFNSIIAKGQTYGTVPSGAYTPANTTYAHSVVAVYRP